MKYITICKALYDYEPQTDEEVSFKEDDILYILENDDPDWWKAQLKTVSLDQVGPIGLIPSNYIDEVRLFNLPIDDTRANTHTLTLTNLLHRQNLSAQWKLSLTIKLSKRKNCLSMKRISWCYMKTMIRIGSLSSQEKVISDWLLVTILKR